LTTNKTYLKIFVLGCIIYLSCPVSNATSQEKHRNKTDSLKISRKNYKYLDSLKPVISGLVITGSKVTNDDVILREMQLSKGQIFTSKQCEEDRLRIFNLGLFVKADVIPLLKPDSTVLLKVSVQEKWYIYPMPSAGIVDGSLSKLWVGASIRWQNFRGKNETANLSFGVGYNPFIHASYTIPWIGKDLHLFTTLSGGYSKDRNRSQLALGRPNGYTFVSYRDFNNNNFDYYNSNFKLTIGKYFSKHFSVYTQAGYTSMQVTEYDTGRTISPVGTDRFLTFGLGLRYDSRNNHEFTTKGYVLQASYEHYGFMDNIVNFGRFNFTQQEFIPVNIKNDYDVILTSRLNTSIAVGSAIPYYNHKFLGFGGDAIRGWYWFGFEGDNMFTLNNEIRIPLFQPNYFEGRQIPLIKKIKYLKDYSYKYGLFITLFYDVGTVWDAGSNVRDLKMLNGTGAGLNAILPFGMNAKVEWGF